jgi:hypothetical protein
MKHDLFYRQNIPVVEARGIELDAYVLESLYRIPLCHYGGWRLALILNRVSDLNECKNHSIDYDYIIEPYELYYQGTVITVSAVTGYVVRWGL